jgi:hypothetical protein
VRAGPNVPPGSYTLIVHAQAGDEQRESKLLLTLAPPEVLMRPDWAVPPEARVVTDPRTGKHYYDRIDVVREGVAVRFLLVLSKGADDLPTFYIMEDKVWAGLFRKFVAAHPELLTNQEWQKVATNKEDDYPILGVVVNDAYECARWLGGHLPTIQQWSKAAGLYEKNRGDGPFQKPADRPPRLAIGGRLMKRTEETDDVSPYRCRHMSGNGLEFTRNLADPNRGMVPLPLRDVKFNDAVSLRGWSIDNKEPLLFHYLEEVTTRDLDDQLYQKSNPQTGFRVVIEP